MSRSYVPAAKRLVIEMVPWLTGIDLGGRRMAFLLRRLVRCALVLLPQAAGRSYQNHSGHGIYLLWFP